MKLLLTGANGFVGRAFHSRWQGMGRPVLAAVRRADQIPVPGESVVADMGAATSWGRALSGCDTVLHLAARVHIVQEQSTDALAAFRAVNAAGTLHLARQAASAGVRRFVFVSSVKVNGEQTRPGHPFTVQDGPQAQDPYALSKAEAEQGLRALAADTGMEVVIVRPPLVYGPGVRANFLSMMRCLKYGVPLPLASVTENRRSLIGVDNLVDLLVTCIDHPAAANQTFLASDGAAMSTAELLTRLGAAMQRPARLFPVPVALLQVAARGMGAGVTVQKLLGSLELDTSHTHDVLKWTPPVSVDEGLRRVAEDFMKS